MTQSNEAPLSSSSRGNAGGVLSVTGEDGQTSATVVPDSGDSGPVTGRFQAVVNIHNCDLHQIEVALEANRHALDPHPAAPGEYVSRHPVLISCWDDSQRDENGNPAPGAPLELDLDAIRALYGKRFEHVSAEAPPEDGSHVSVEGMHFIAELDSNGTPTGRVVLGNPPEAQR